MSKHNAHAHTHGYFSAEPDESTKNLLAQNLEKGAVIVDYGCGIGRYCGVLSEYAKRLYCVDVNEEALQLVKARFEDAITISSTESIEGNSVDTVLLANSFHDFEDKEFAVSEILRILKYGGKVIVIDWKKADSDKSGALFGPPMRIRMSKEDYKNYFKKFRLINALDINETHYGLIFSK
ncbi:MAG: class I SAM-dependent methyltransferase [Candidatus Micrarchaeaceae archaeon]